jgi:magnesium transporter
MIKVCVHSRDGALDNDLPIAAISEVIGRANHRLWVDVIDPTDGDLHMLDEEFGFHPLAMEDARRRHQRPKLDRYDDFLFMVFYGLELVDDQVAAREVALFIGSNFLLTMHDGPLASIEEAARRCRAHADHPHGAQSKEIGLLVHTVLDSIVDGYFPVIDALEERIEAIEEIVFNAGQADHGQQALIFHLKKDLLAVRRVLTPERDVMIEIVRREDPTFGPEVLPYFQDVYDHILRVTDAVDLYRDLLTSVLEVHLSMTSYRLNEVVKRLTSSSIILMTMTLVAGIYGMNFHHMPELGWQFGYAWALALMVALGATLIVIFRRIDWL